MLVSGLLTLFNPALFRSYREGLPKKVAVLFRVAELGGLSSGTKMAMKIFVMRVFTIFATNASFLRIIANLHI